MQELAQVQRELSSPRRKPAPGSLPQGPHGRTKHVVREEEWGSKWVRIERAGTAWGQVPSGAGQVIIRKEKVNASAGDLRQRLTLWGNAEARVPLELPQDSLEDFQSPSQFQLSVTKSPYQNLLVGKHIGLANPEKDDSRNHL